MKLSTFIRNNQDRLLAEWEQFAATQMPDGQEVRRDALRDYAAGLLSSIADELDRDRDPAERRRISRGRRRSRVPSLTNSARIHALDRFHQAFTQAQLLAEFRAMRATTISLWRKELETFGEAEFDELVHFNEAVDQLVIESAARFEEVSDDARQRQKQALVDRHDRLLEDGRQKDLFLAALGHELRNPLAGLDLGIRALKEGIGDRPRMEALIEEEVRRLTVLTNNLLDASRLARDRIRLNVAPLDVADLIRSVAGTLQSEIDDKRQTLRQDIAEAAPIVADRVRLRQIVENLLANAVHHTPQEGTIRLSLSADDDGVTLTVTDTGNGLTAQEVDGIFEPLTGQHPDQDGLGLGLSIARRLAELHGGSLTAASPGPGCGATFTLMLPRESATGHHNQARAHASTLIESGQRLPGDLRVAVVDDDVEFADSLALFLRVRGCRAESFHTGTDLLERLEDIQPHAILLDVTLPDLSGFDLAAALRDRAVAERTLLIATTGRGDDETIERLRAAGFHDHLLKPLDLERLVLSLWERSTRE